MPTRLMRALARGLLAAMLLAVLAPAISRALVSTRVAGDWVELCTSQGMQWVQVASANADTDPVSASDLLHSLDHCGHCGLSAERFAPLLPSVPTLLALAARWAVPGFKALRSLSVAAPRPSARGPPLLN
jgi:Protein of unknown function (DUF2946)